MQLLRSSLRDYFQGGLAQFLRKVSLRIRFRFISPLLSPVKSYRSYKEFRGKAVVVYSMGKVGSSSIFYTLMRELPVSSVYHNHFLSDYWLTKRLPNTQFTRNIRLAENTLDAIKVKNRVFYIVPVRDPVARDISNLFQNASNNGIDLRDGIEELVGGLQQLGHRFFVEWFDSEFKEYTGLDIREIEFNHDLGFSIVERGSSTYLFIALESVGARLTDVISNFLNIDIGTEYRFNETTTKSNSDIFKAVKDSYYILPEMEEDLYNNDIMRKLYSESQIEKFKNRWRK